MKREFWRVVFTAYGVSDHWEFYVFASSAAKAESVGYPLAEEKSKDYTEPGRVYCISAELKGYIEGNS